MICKKEWLEKIYIDEPEERKKVNVIFLPGIIEYPPQHINCPCIINFIPIKMIKEEKEIDKNNFKIMSGILFGMKRILAIRSLS